MRVVALLHAYVPEHGAGAEHHAHTLLSALASRGHDVVVALTQPSTWQGDTRWTVDGVTVIGRADKTALDSAMAGAKVLITHLESTARANAAGRKRSIPVVNLLHNTFDATRQWLSRDRVDLAVANSQWMANVFADAPVPVDILRPLTPVKDYETTRGDRVTLVNLFPNKGPQVLWQLAQRLPKQKFLAVRGGYGWQDIPDEIPANVEVIDNTPNVRDDILARTRLLLMPSGYESWGRMGVEAMCAGIKVIAAPTPGLVESLGDAGTFVNRDDIDGWVAAVKKSATKAAADRAAPAAKARAAEVEKVSRADHDRVAERIEFLGTGYRAPRQLLRP